jgi:hypothetical protein
MSILHNASVKLISFILVLSLLVVSSAAVMAQDQSAPRPTWTTGQIWALGGERDLSNVLGENLGNLQDTLDLLNISMNNPQMTGSAGAWVVFKVIEVKQEAYLLEYSTGLRIHGNLGVYLTGLLPRAGIYDLSNMTLENKSVSGDASFNLLITSHGVITMDKGSMAVTGIVSTSVLDESLNFNATNFPNYSTSGILPTRVNMTFENYAINESLHMNLASTMDFTPALSLINFPLTVGNNWTVHSKMTIGGTAEGFFNATGLPSTMDSQLVQKNGVFNGSVRIEDLTSLGTMKMDNGTITPTDRDVQTTMQCIGTKTIDDGSGNNITVYDVKEKESGAHLYFSPNTEFLATALVKPQLDMLSGLVILPGNSIISSLNLNTEISMTSIDTTTATNKISQIGSYQGVEPVSLISSTDTTGTGAAQDSTVLIFIMAAIVVILVGVGGVLYLRKRSPKKP